MQAVYQEILPPTGVDFATTLNLTPSTLASKNNGTSSPTPLAASTSTSHVLTNLITAKNNWLRIYEVREEEVQLPSLSNEERKAQNSTKSRRGTEAVAGEIEMDSKGEGFVSVDTVKVLTIPKYILFLFS